MPKVDKLSKSDKKMLTKVGKKTLKDNDKKSAKGQKVDRSDVPLISSLNRDRATER
jgi:hypothetical protein